MNVYIRIPGCLQAEMRPFGRVSMFAAVGAEDGRDKALANIEDKVRNAERIAGSRNFLGSLKV